MGSAVPKQLLELAGRPLLDYPIAAFEEAPGVDRVVLVITPGFRQAAERIVAAGRYSKVTDILDGGATRTASTRRALAALPVKSAGSAADVNVLFHDAARPLVEQAIIADCLAELRSHSAVTAAVPTTDTILQVDAGVITAIPDRARLQRCQTPQGFRLTTIRRAYELADAHPDSVVAGGFEATDDCAVVLRFLPEVPIRVVPGSARNMKITEPADLAIAERLLHPVR